jgi:dihydrofolate synthase/folylpolyglutamate synthase
MAYTDLIEWMFNLERFGIKLGLENITEFLSRTGNPHRDFRSVHVTGTNGKGSVCAFLASILRESGLKVGLYTSPHLVDFRERITIDGEMISEEDVVRLGNDLRGTMENMARESSEKQLTFFGFTTGLAFKYFSEKKVDIAVLEVGMGGRMDATNVVSPEVAVITRIGLEHTAYLGNTVAEIAREKAGIIKQGVPVVCSDRNPESLSVVMSTCQRKDARLTLVDEDFRVANVKTGLDGTSFDFEGEAIIRDLGTRLIGAYQAENAGVAIAAAERLKEIGYPISADAVRDGVFRTIWPGRLDVRSKEPLLVLDGSHNPEGVHTSCAALSSIGLTPLTFVVACMSDKDARGIVSALAPHASKMIVTEVKVGRSAKASHLAELAEASYTGEVVLEGDPAKAMVEAFSDMSGKGVCAIGSFYLVGEVMKWLGTRGPTGTYSDGARKV